MGAEVDTEVMDGELTQERFEEMVTERRLDHGRIGYTGTFAEVTKGVAIHSREPFPSEWQAQTWLEERAEKWECAHAVRFSSEEPGSPRWLVLAVYSA